MKDIFNKQYFKIIINKILQYIINKKKYLIK